VAPLFHTSQRLHSVVSKHVCTCAGTKGKTAALVVPRDTEHAGSRFAGGQNKCVGDQHGRMASQPRFETRLVVIRRDRGPLPHERRIFQISSSPTPPSQSLACRHLDAFLDNPEQLTGLALGGNFLEVGRIGGAALRPLSPSRRQWAQGQLQQPRVA